MKLKDYIRMKYFLFKHRKKGILVFRNSLIKRTYFEGKNMIGENSKILDSYVGYGTYFNAENNLNLIKIGKYCSIGSRLNIVIGQHKVQKNVSTFPGFYSIDHEYKNKLGICYTKKNKFEEKKIVDGKYNIVIGNDVWIGSDVKIFQGIKIGDGAVIGTGALVTKNVESYSIVGGIPAKLIRKRFSQEDEKFLLRLKWWDKGEPWIKEYGDYFDDIDELKKVLNGRKNEF